MYIKITMDGSIPPNTIYRRYPKERILGTNSLGLFQFRNRENSDSSPKPYRALVVEFISTRQSRSRWCFTDTMPRNATGYWLATACRRERSTYKVSVPS
ncbi:hypothetical protein K0M31_016207 [Melipona bicolor]|uniref:Uncharacterized protein n=1 Tax=Melipona bicolor TaxID=60889 RepID=A0AA40G6Y1_9HYME|nr:hypothetical protein K0M31_016207 [Melipona bicolor]